LCQGLLADLRVVQPAAGAVVHAAPEPQTQMYGGLTDNAVMSQVMLVLYLETIVDYTLLIWEDAWSGQQGQPRQHGTREQRFDS